MAAAARQLGATFRLGTSSAANARVLVPTRSSSDVAFIGPSCLRLFGYKTACHRPGLRRRRDRERQPRVHPMGTVVRIELEIALQTQEALHVADRKQVSDLRSGPD